MQECKECGDPKKFAEFLREEYPAEIAERMLGVKGLFELGAIDEDTLVKRLNEIQEDLQKAERNKGVGLGLLDTINENFQLLRKLRPRFFAVQTR